MVMTISNCPFLCLLFSKSDSKKKKTPKSNFHKEKKAYKLLVFVTQPLHSFGLLLHTLPNVQKE